jgi:hypothetical protein
MVARERLATVAVGGGVTVETQPSPADVARVTQDEPRDNMQPVLWLNALLSGYAGLQLLNAITAFDLLQEGYGEKYSSSSVTWITLSGCCAAC